MGDLIDFNKLKDEPLLVQLRERFEKERVVDEYDLLSRNSGYSSEVISKLDEEYDLYYQKLDVAKTIDNSKVHMYLENIKKIDDIDFLSSKQKLKMMASYGILVKYFNYIHELEDNELFLLSAVSSQLDLEDYTYYVGVLSTSASNSSVVPSRVIVYRTKDFYEQVEIANRVMYELDNYPYDYLTPDNFDELSSAAKNVIYNYKVKNNKSK